MNSPAQRDHLRRRCYELESRIADLHAGKVIDGDPAAIEGKLLEEQDEIEYEPGLDEFQG
jgi:hypothetical protein